MACSKMYTSTLNIELNHTSFKTIYKISLADSNYKIRYVYTINNLRIDLESNTVSLCTQESKSQ